MSRLRDVIKNPEGNAEEVEEGRLNADEDRKKTRERKKRRQAEERREESARNRRRTRLEEKKMHEHGEEAQQINA
ncbi:hypothetical protein NDU88_005402 [Pleurodeles waltl]|uniref:Uncharacterized protein n=1 Tax=Pleurodeles waltl TaxID=8319 RepID=A0AAV7UI33_PLEWA|nr:hypothetical protein NDU88_005402 [Pleurodeles waltl]